MKTAIVRRKDVTIQLSDTASALNSTPIEGSATFIEEVAKAVIKEERVVMKRIVKG
jgi:hypothetical protein